MIRLWGRMTWPFRYARVGNWWFSKIPPLLAVAYLLVLNRDIEFGRAVLLIGCFVFSVTCVAAYGHAINDACDVEQDRQAGKENSMAALGWSSRLLVILTFLCAGFLPAIFAEYSVAAILLLALNYLWPTIYSVPGIRLKERGVWGIITDAMGSHVTPTLFALAVFGALPAVPAGQLGFVIAVTLWAAAVGIKGILHHQIMDRDNDVKSGTVTLSTKMPARSLWRFLTWFNLTVELPISIALAIVVYRWCPLAAAALAAYGALEALKYVLGFKFQLGTDTQLIRANAPFANELFYVFWMPFAAAVQLASTGPEWLWLPVLHLAIFYQVTVLQGRDLKCVMAAIARPYRRLLVGPRK